MFYVYHKVKGDRAGSADYELLFSDADRKAADAFAEKYNTQHGYTPRGIHCAVVRTRQVKQM